MLIGTPAVSALVREKKTFQLQSVIQTGKKDGMQSMDEAVLQLVREGPVAPADAIAHLSCKDLLPTLERIAPRRPLRSRAA